MDCPVCKAPGMCVCPSPETTDVRERARRVVVQAMDYKLLVPHAFKIIDALAAANLLRTPNVAATGGASAETLSPQDRDALERLRYLRNEHGSMNGRIRPEDAGAYALGFSDASIGRRVEVTRLTEDLAARTGERDANADTINLILAEAGVERSGYLAVKIVETFDPSHKLPCGHHPSLEIRSVESDYRACDLCEARSMMRDAETMERRHRDERDALQQRVGALEAAIAWACGYMVGEPFRERRDGEGAFYWRNELRERSGMVKADFLAAEDRALSQTPTPNAKTEGV